MIRIGCAPGAFDLFRIGHLNVLRAARSRCNPLVAGVVRDDMPRLHKGITPVVPFEERLDRDFATVGAGVIHLPRMLSTSSTALRTALRNVNEIGERLVRGNRNSTVGNREPSRV